MAVGLLREGIRAQLSWLDVTGEEALDLSQLYLRVIFTWHRGLPEGEAVNALYASHEIGSYDGELDLERFFSREDLDQIASGEHPYYNFEASETERLGQFLKELIDNKIAPAVIYDYWQNLLKEFGGDEFQALVELSFRKPVEAS